MTAKQYLRQLSRLNKQIRAIEEELEERRTRLTSITAPVTGDKVQTSVHGDRFADMIAALADLDRTWEALKFEYELQRDKMVHEILDMDNELYREILRRHYIQEQKLIQVAAEMHYSYDWIRRLHGKALVAFAKKYLM